MGNAEAKAKAEDSPRPTPKDKNPAGSNSVDTSAVTGKEAAATNTGEARDAFSERLAKLLKGCPDDASREDLRYLLEVARNHWYISALVDAEVGKAVVSLKRLLSSGKLHNDAERARSKANPAESATTGKADDAISKRLAELGDLCFSEEIKGELIHLLGFVCDPHYQHLLVDAPLAEAKAALSKAIEGGALHKQAMDVEPKAVKFDFEDEDNACPPEEMPRRVSFDFEFED